MEGVMRLADLRTPALVLDRAVLAANIAAMSARARSFDVDLKPHMKTSKCAEIARLATAGHSGGICVSTVQEVGYFAREGFRDITYAVGIAPGKLADLGPALATGARVTLLLDDPATAHAVAERAEALDLRFPVLIEIDSGMHRAGLPPESPGIVETGRILADASHLTSAGVLTHGGQSYGARGPEDCRAAAEDERRAIVAAAKILIDTGIPCPRIAPGATPNAVHMASAEGLTEIRPGNYVFYDLHMVSIGACRPEQIAVSVLATVIGHNRARNQMVIDAGALALSLDASAQYHLPEAGYGWLCDAAGRGRLGDLRLGRLSQEHGVVASDRPLPFENLPIGARVRVLPSHSCMTAAAYPAYHLVEGGETVVDRWERTNGW
jgi:D-serine deaminase-like pyridoxal phosphate-dependent protein